MPIAARYSRTSSCSRSERFSSGILSIATINSQIRAAQRLRTYRGARAHQHFHQELQDLNMALRFLQARTPSIKPMLPQKKTVNAGALSQGYRRAFPQLNHVLRILENRQPFAVLVSSNAFQPLQHFVSFERNSTLRSMRTRKHRAPNRMRVQDCARGHATHDGKMEQCFRGRPAIPAHDVGRLVHLQKLRGPQAALVQSCRSNRQTQRLARNHRAEISARPQNPPARVKSLSNFSEGNGGLREAGAV